MKRAGDLVRSGYRSWPVLAVVVLGLMLSAFLFSSARSQEKKTLETAFEQESRVRLAALERELVTAVEVIESLGSLYDASELVERDEFRSFVSGQLARHQTIETLQWAPFVRGDQRITFEQAATNDGLKDFQFTIERDKGVLVRAPQQDQYFPTFYVQPMDGNEAAAGYDHSSNATHMEAIRESWETGATLATGGTTLVQEEDARIAFILMKPVYVGGFDPGTVEGRRASLLGFVLGQFKLDELVTQSFVGFEEDLVEMRLTDAMASPNESVLYTTIPGQDLSDGSGSSLTYQAEVDIGQRVWKAEFAPKALLVDQFTTDRRWEVLGVTLGITGIFAGFYTALQRRRRAADESERRFQLLAENVEAIFWLNDPSQPGMTYVSPGFESVTGVPEEAAHADIQAWLSIVHPEDRDRASQHLDPTVATARHEDFRIVRPDGSERWLNSFVFPVEGEEGNGESLAGVAVDITSRKRTEEELKHIAAALGNANDSVIMAQLDGTISYANSVTETLFGYKVPELVNTKIFDLHPPEAVETARELFKETMEGGWSGEIQGLRKNGDVFPMRLSTALVRNDRNRPIGIVGIAADVTERKRMEEDLRESNAKLQETLTELRSAQDRMVEQERLQALGTMASGVAHDFNNALGPILGYSDLLLMYPDTLDDREKTMGYIEAVNTAAKDAGEVVNRLRDFYRRRDDTDLVAPVDVNRVVGEVVSLTRPRWQDMTQGKGIEIVLSTELPADIPLVDGNDAGLRTALTNLVFNAIDAMPEGGSLTLATGQEDGGVVVRVEDTGTGMADDVRRRATDPFFTTKGDGGTGMGLATTFGIVRRHQGSLDIQSALGAGTTVTVRLPINAEAQRDGFGTSPADLAGEKNDEQ